jgi:tRNA(His) 5'-end guanylyltransferase
MFDARVFNIPKEEVTNCVYWRQLDAIKNSISSMGQAHFSHKELHNKGRETIKNMLSDKGVIWDDLPTHLQRGSCCIKMPREKTLPNGDTVECLDWAIDFNIPIFKDDGRDYIDKLIMV